MGAIFNAQANHSPLLITAGQQARAQMTLQANLTNRDATRMPHPLVKWSYEPPRAEDVPLALAHGAHLAALPPRGPVFVSMPMDDWDVEVDDADAQPRSTAGSRPRHADPEAVRALAERLDAATNPVLVAGPDIDASGAWDARRSPSPSASACRSGRRPPPAAAGSASPRAIPTSAACCRRRSARSAQTLEGHDLILVVGSSVFPYYPYIPGPLLPEGAKLVAITSDPDEAARAPMGDAIVADVKLTLEALLAAVPESSAPGAGAEPRPAGNPADRPAQPLDRPHRARPRSCPRTAIVVLESPSSTLALRNQLRLSRPGSYYFGAGGGLGFGLAASVGVQLAQPDRPVVCVLGEGSAQYAITAFWSAVAYEVPVTFLVLRNEEYAILKWFAEVEEVSGAPGLDLPKLDVAAVAEGYGVKAHRASDRDEVARRPRRGRSPPRSRSWSKSRSTPGMSLF